ncbi:MAG TPA: FCD domain-containing protein [Ilumatobacter sp.]|nr:FCD domain-containing protein [Ilumatobacter sp.]
MERVIRRPRLADTVAGELRNEILNGTLQLGDRLAPQDVLIKRFDVGLPTIREALGILENEGLLVVRRGSVGGAIVQPPEADRVAYMTGLVLQANRAKLNEVTDALASFEPVCAGLCAGRSDRRDELVPNLAAVVAEQREYIGSNESGMTETSLRFHELIIDGCGNAAVALTVRSLFALWRAHMRAWATTAEPAGEYPDAGLQRDIVRAHERMCTAIDAGDVAEATRLATKHAARSHAHHLGEPSVGANAMVVCDVLR